MLLSNPAVRFITISRKNQNYAEIGNLKVQSKT